MLSRLLARAWATAGARFGAGAAILAGTVALHGAATLQDFSNPGAAGTPFVTQQLGDAPGPIISGGIATVTSDSGGQRNYLTFDSTGLTPANTPFVFSFDYRMSAEAGHSGCCGERADGFGFALVDTNVHGAAGPVGDIWGAVEQDAVASALTIGFDIFTGAGSDGTTDDNRVLLGWNGANVATMVFGPAFKLNQGVWMRVDGKITQSGSDLAVDLSITPAGGATQVVFAGQVIAGATMNYSRPFFAGRTGGAFVKVDVDNVRMYSDFPASTAASITTQPVDTVVTETFPATFTVGVAGTPPFTVQWFSNGVAIPGENQFSYSIPVATTNMSGSVFSVTVSNEFNTAAILSDEVSLTVNPALLAQSAASRGYNNKVFVTFLKPVTLSGTYTLDNGATVSSIAAGATANEVVLTTSPLTANTTYQVTITGETATDGSMLAPTPTILSFYQGFGGFCTDFAAVPAGSAVFGNAYVGDDGTGTNNVLRVTDAVNSQTGSLVISNLTGANALDRLYATFDVYMGDGTCCGTRYADGMSFNWAAGLPFGTLGGAEEGTGTGLTIAFDSWDNSTPPAAPEAPAIDVKWGGAVVGSVKMDIFRNGTNFVPVSVSVDPDGTLDLSYDGIQVYKDLVLPGFAPIANSRVGIYARTGGANENAWVDNLCINNFNIGDVTIVQQPANTEALEGNTATFRVVLDGTPPYTYQWFTNGVAVAGATGATYTTPPATEAMEGMTVWVEVSNEFSMVRSADAVLDVNLSPRLVSIEAVSSTLLRFVYTRPVELDGMYTFNNGIFFADAQYGETENVVMVTVDPLMPLTLYEVTVSDLHSQGSGEAILPNPTVRTFHFGYGTVCANFNDNTVPAGWIVRANTGVSTRVADGFVHLTDAANDQNGTFFIPDQNAGLPMDRLLMTFRLQLSHPVPNTRIADGISLSIGPEVQSGANPAEEGTPVTGGSGLIIAFDTYDNAGADTAPAIEIKYKGSVVATQATAGIRDAGRAPSGPLLTDLNGHAVSLDTSNQWINVVLSVTPDGKLDLYYGDVKVFSGLQLPNYMPFVGANYSFGGRTGGANENAWIDDVCINANVLDAPMIVQQPANAVVNEPGSATFSVQVNGAPPLSFQWYSNNVAIAGAVGPNYLTPFYDRVADGWQYYVVVSNAQGVVTSEVATLTFNRDEVAPSVVSAQADCSGNVFVLFSEPLQASSATDINNYSINNGITVNSATLLPGNWVRLSVSPAPAPSTTSTLTVNGVRDVLGYNAIANGMANFSVKSEPISGNGTMIVIEAEDYDLNISPGGQTPNSRFYLSNSLPGFSGSGYMDAQPNTGAGGGDAPATFTNATALHYCINVPTAGRYYIWARGSTANDGGNNSFHLGIDGVSPNDFSRRVGNAVANWGTDAGNVNAFGWVRDSFGGPVAYIDIATPGVHTLNVWMREDGIRLDKILLTTDSAFTLTPTEIGPSGSIRGIGPRLSISKAADGTVTITWPGTGWTLQGTDALRTPPSATEWMNLPFTSPVVIPPGFFPTAETNVFFRLIQ